MDLPRPFALPLAGVALLAGCAEPEAGDAPAPDAQGPAYASSAPLLLGATWQDPSALEVEAPESRVIVHLFEWRWADVAEECEVFLGPMGYDAVQLSPAAENAVVEGRPWWERYQPASYLIDNRSGDREDFADMVRRCNDAGVEVYPDVIANHMTGVYSGLGTAGSTFGEYDYPGLYAYDDFHHCGLTEGDEMVDGSDPVQATTCELVNLADLATEQEHVRDRIAAHLNDLLSLGVDGFRLDAIRHVSPEDTEAILSRLDREVFIFSEVVDPAAPSWSEPYYPFGVVTNFTYSGRIGPTFWEGDLTGLYGEGSIWEDPGMLPSEESLVFVDNHDNQRGRHGEHIVTHKDGDLYDLTVAFMLAFPYGTTRVMSSFAFENPEGGPPTVPGTEEILPVHGEDGLRCNDGTWVCEHRRASIAPMVRFRSVTAGVPLEDWWTGTPSQIAFSRGDRGFFALNRDESARLEASLQTGLPAGMYCNVLDGVLSDGGCTGTAVTVGPDGVAEVAVPAMRALALHVDARVE